MNLKFLITAFILFSCSLRAQPVNVFSRVYQTVGADLYQDLVVKAKGDGCLIVGHTDNAAALLRIDSLGNYMWCKLTNRNIRYQDFIANADTTYSALITKVNNTTDSLIVMRLNQHGGLIWSKAVFFNNSTNVIPVSLAATLDSGVAFCGSAVLQGANSQQTSAAVIGKLDKNGTLLWSRTVQLNNAGTTARSVRQTPDSGFVMIGGTGSNPALVKLDRAGAVVWAKTYSGSNQLLYMGADLVVRSKKIFSYFYNGSPVLASMDSSGNVLTALSYNTNLGNFTNFSGYRISNTQDLGFYLTGGSDYFNLMKLDSSRNAQWQCSSYQKGSAAQLDDKGFAIAIDGPVIGGRGPGNSQPQVGFSKIDSGANIGIFCDLDRNSVNTTSLTLTATAATYSQTINGVSQLTTIFTSPIAITTSTGCVDYIGGFNAYGLPAKISVYPNPSAGKVTLACGAAIPAPARCVIFDLSGRMVHEENLRTDATQVIDCSQLSPAMYMLKIFSQGRLYESSKLSIERY